MITPYWLEVIKVVNTMTDINLSLDAACCLLNINSFSLKSYKHSLSRHLLTSAKSLVPPYWKTPSVPSIKTWLLKVAEICEMEDTVAQANDSVDQFHKMWSSWFSFKFSDEYARLTTYTKT